MAGWAWCNQQIQQGAATSMYGPDAEFNVYLLEHGGCKNLAYAPRLRSLQMIDSFFLIGQQGTSSFQYALATNFTIGLTELRRDQDYVALSAQWALQGQRCADEQVDDQVEETRLKLSHLEGLFIVVYAMLAVATFGALVERLCGINRSEEQESTTDCDQGHDTDHGAQESTLSDMDLCNVTCPPPLEITAISPK